jgi:DNA-binding transcriptional LysR family regulator
MSDPIDDLRLLTVMVAEGSLAGAAKRLRSSAPAMSRRLTAMEQRLGVRLIERGARRFFLTEQGALLHERALKIVRDVDEAEAEASAKGNASGGPLRVGAPTELGRRVIAPLLSRFRQQYPQITVLLVLSDAGLDPVDDELDIVLRNGMPQDPSVIVRKLLTSRRIVCATPAYLAKHGTPQVPDDLLQHDCIRLVRGRHVFDRWPFNEQGKRRFVHVQGTLSSTSGEVMHDWIVAGEGIGLKALWDVHEEVRSGALVECLSPYWCDEIELYACFASRGHMPQRVRTFTDYLAAQVADASNPGTFP